jgi:hypothetical protein
MSSLGATLRSLAFLLMLGLLMLAVFTARALIDGSRSMTESDVAFDRGDLRTSIVHARRAAILYAPGAPHVGRAYERLNAIAVGAEAAGQPKTAFLAWQAVRSAALETRHVFQPRQTELDRANLNLARLEAELRGAKADQIDRLQKQALARFRGDTGAGRLVWTLALAFGFGLALAGLLLFALRGITRDGAIVAREARLGALLALVGAACWTIAVLKA